MIPFRSAWFWTCTLLAVPLAVVAVPVVVQDVPQAEAQEWSPFRPSWEDPPERRRRPPPRERRRQKPLFPTNPLFGEPSRPVPGQPIPGQPAAPNNQLAFPVPPQEQKPLPPQDPLVDERPYDDKLIRLTEILGAIHYLRELCGADEGQLWRDQMKEVLKVEGTTAIRRAKLVNGFNKGYRGYRRTYRTCTKPAKVAITRFFDEGTQITKVMVKDDE